MTIHVNPNTGNTGPCGADSPETCPFQKNSDVPLHFDTKEEAQRAAEQLMERENHDITLTSHGTSASTPRFTAKQLRRAANKVDHTAKVYVEPETFCEMVQTQELMMNANHLNDANEHMRNVMGEHYVSQQDIENNREAYATAMRRTAEDAVYAASVRNGESSRRLMSTFVDYDSKNPSHANAEQKSLDSLNTIITKADYGVSNTTSTMVEDMNYTHQSDNAYLSGERYAQGFDVVYSTTNEKNTPVAYIDTVNSMVYSAKDDGQPDMESPAVRWDSTTSEDEQKRIFVRHLSQL